MFESNECSNPQGWQCREDPVWLAAPQPLSRGTRHGLATWTHQAEPLWEYTIPPTQKQMPLLLLAMTTMSIPKMEHHHQHTPHFPNPSSTPPLCWRHKPWCTDAQPWHICHCIFSSKWRKVKGWSISPSQWGPRRRRTSTQCGFCVEAPQPTMDAQQAERPVREEGSFSTCLRLDL